eukprot:scaffold33574_cov157-Skeletonema_dohrnii-CCMP3373.AAC.5
MATESEREQIISQYIELTEEELDFLGVDTMDILRAFESFRDPDETWSFLSDQHCQTDSPHYWNIWIASPELERCAEILREPHDSDDNILTRSLQLEPTFRDCPSLRLIIIPDVKVVETEAFAGCRALTDVKCGKLETIEDSAFSACESLRIINLPSVENVGEASTPQPTESSQTAKPDDGDVKEKLSEYKVRWGTFNEKEQMVQALCNAMEQRFVQSKNFSRSGSIIPGEVTDVTESVLLEEMGWLESDMCMPHGVDHAKWLPHNLKLQHKNWAQHVGS